MAIALLFASVYTVNFAFSVKTNTEHDERAKFVLLTNDEPGCQGARALILDGANTNMEQNHHTLEARSYNVLINVGLEKT